MQPGLRLAPEHGARPKTSWTGPAGNSLSPSLAKRTRTASPVAVPSRVDFLRWPFSRRSGSRRRSSAIKPPGSTVGTGPSSDRQAGHGLVTVAAFDAPPWHGSSCQLVGRIEGRRDVVHRPGAPLPPAKPVSSRSNPAFERPDSGPAVEAETSTNRIAAGGHFRPDAAGPVDGRPSKARSNCTPPCQSPDPNGNRTPLGRRARFQPTMKLRGTSTLWGCLKGALDRPRAQQLRSEYSSTSRPVGTLTCLLLISMKRFISFSAGRFSYARTGTVDLSWSMGFLPVHRRTHRAGAGRR